MSEFLNQEILGRILHDEGGGEADKDQTLNTIMKIVSIVVILIMASGFGVIPLFWKSCKGSVLVSGLSNAFSSGIFLGIAIFHLLPEANEGFENYFKSNNTTGLITKIPISYFLVFFSFTLIMFIEKIAFDSHALIEHDHGDSPDQKELKIAENKSDHSSDSSEEDEEDVMKNMVSTQGRMGSFIAENNISKNKNAQVDKNMLRASQVRKSVLETQEKLEDVFQRIQPISKAIPPKPVNMQKENVETHDHEQEVSNDTVKAIPSSQTSELTPYLLLAALSFHGLFEGIALGLQTNAKSTISLFLAIIAHKWAEALTLGLSFAKTGTEKTTFIKMIIIFSVFTPIGIGFGMILNSFPSWVTSSFMSLSVGTFIYIGAAEIVVEEFSITRFKWQKYLMYLIGAFFIAGLTLWEIAGGEHEEEDHDHDHEGGKMRMLLNLVKGIIS